MGALRNVIIAILAISFLTFVAFFGRLPGFRNTPIGFLHRVLWIHVPNAFRRVDQLVTGGRISKALADFGDYLFSKKHPIVLVRRLLFAQMESCLQPHPDLLPGPSHRGSRTLSVSNMVVSPSPSQALDLNSPVAAIPLHLPLCALRSQSYHQHSEPLLPSQPLPLR